MDHFYARKCMISANEIFEKMSANVIAPIFSVFVFLTNILPIDTGVFALTAYLCLRFSEALNFHPQFAHLMQYFFSSTARSAKELL